MMFPSNIRRPRHESVEVKEVDKGVYTFENAYDGRYEYFTGRLIAETSASEKADVGSSDVPPATNVKEG